MSEKPRPVRNLTPELAFWLQRPLPGIGGGSIRNHAAGRPRLRCVVGITESATVAAQAARSASEGRAGGE